MKTKKPTMLMILDGWGLRAEEDFNAIKIAHTPNMDELCSKYPFTSLSASGESVGLPDGQMGNSEVGHLNIGAGRIVYQDLTLISKEIREGTFFNNKTLNALMDKMKTKDSALHLIGLLSDGGVHSHIEHLFALLKLAKTKNIVKVYIHAILDGRDTAPDSGVEYIKKLENVITELKIGEISTVCGRYYAMDRDNRWDREKKAYDAFVRREGNHFPTALEGIKASYENGITDEFVEPIIIDNTSDKGIKSSDGIIFFNFRPDRAREITRVLSFETKEGFAEDENELIKDYVCMAEYDATFKLPIAYPPRDIKNTLGEVVSKAGLKQLRIAETEKYAHVTFFFNGGVETPNENEDRVLIPSPKVATYDLKPEMSAIEVTEKVIENIEKDVYDLIILNYANADMVGHTGILPAAVSAVTALDECVGKVVETIMKKNGNICITADHGNAELMAIDSTHPYTAHTTNRVPFVLVGEEYKGESLREDGILADIAPTLLEMLSIKKPSEMTGKSLITKK